MRFLQTVKEAQGHLFTVSHEKKNNSSVRVRKVYLILVRLTDRSSWKRVNTT